MGTDTTKRHIQQRVIWWLYEDFVQIRLLWHPIVTKQTSLSQINTLKKKEQKNAERVSEETCQSVSRTVKICRTLQCQKRKSDISQLTQRVIATSWVNSIYFPDNCSSLYSSSRASLKNSSNWQVFHSIK